MTNRSRADILSALEVNSDGNIVTRPIMGWTTVPAETAVILRLNYAENPDELRTGGRHLQVILTPQQCLELAQILTKQAQRILEAPRPTGKPN